MGNKTRLMRVPEKFYGTIKRISEKRGQNMVSTLERSNDLLNNADYLSDLLGGIRGKGKHKKKGQL